jgi:hypothetical protein
MQVEETMKFLTKFSFRGPIAFMIVLCGFGFLFMLLYKTVPSENKDLVLLASGLVLGLMKDVAGWLFGSSKKEADAEKAGQIKDLLNNQQP